MDDDLKLVERLRARISNPTLMEEAVAAITRLRAENEALKSGAATASETLRLLYASQGKDRDTIDGLVKERDEALAQIARRDAVATAFEADELDGLAAKWPRVVKVILDAERRAETAEAQRDAALEALRPFAECAKHDIGESDDDDDAFRNSIYNRAPRITYGHFRAASRTLEGE